MRLDLLFAGRIPLYPPLIGRQLSGAFDQDFFIDRSGPCEFNEIVFHDIAGFIVEFHRQ